MDNERLARLIEATRLTTRGRVAEATALIQDAAAGPTAGGHAPPAGAVQPGGQSSRAAGLRWPQAATVRNLRAMPDVRPPAELRDLLSRLPGGAGPATVQPRPRADWPGRYYERSYANAAGERAYKLYLPSGYTGTPAPLVVMLHGGTQNADDFAAGTRMNELAERHGWLVVYPEQSRSANPMGYWNWFNPGDQARGSGEASLLAGLTHHVAGEHAVDPARVFVAGFSAGGAMAAVLAAAYPDVFAAVGVHSGLPAGAAHDVASAFTAMRQGAQVRPGRVPVPTIVFHGDADPTVEHVNAECLVRAALPVDGQRAPQVSADAGQVPGGRAYTRKVFPGTDGAPLVEQWTVHQAGHAWSGGSPDGSYTDPHGPDASAELVRFFAARTGRPAG